MKITPRILAESQFNPYGKEIVVVEGYSPEEVLAYLPNALLIIQNTEEEYETIFSCESDVINTLKPSIFICEEPTPEQEGLCSVLGTVVISLDDLSDSIKVVEKLESVTLDFVEEEMTRNSNLDVVFPNVMFPYSDGGTSYDSETK